MTPCAILAGYVPAVPYEMDRSHNLNPTYHRISDGKKVWHNTRTEKSEVGKEIARVIKLWKGSDHEYFSKDGPFRNQNYLDNSIQEVRPRYAIKWALSKRIKIETWYDPAKSPFKEAKGIAKGQSALADYVIEVVKQNPDATTGKLLQKWEKNKPGCVDEIITADRVRDYKVKFTTYSLDKREIDYGGLESQIRRAKKG